MAWDDNFGAPERMMLISTATGDRVDAQFNPAEFDESIGSVYSKQQVVGLSHPVKQFVNTDDWSVTLTLRFQSVDTAQHKVNLTARKRLQSWQYPRRDANALGRAGAPRVLFVWPNLISLTCVIISVKFHYLQFARNGEPTRFDAALQIEEIRDTLILADEVEDLGTQRS